MPLPKILMGLRILPHEDVRHQQSDDDDEDNMMSSCQIGARAGRGSTGAGQAAGLEFVPVFGEEQVFFAEADVFDMDEVGTRVSGGEKPGAFDGVAVDIPAQDIFFLVALYNVHAR